jgi:putative transcriptional regulator
MTATIIKNIRATLNMTQQEFVYAVDVSVRTVQDWEQGRRSPDRRSLKAIRREFNI